MIQFLQQWVPPILKPPLSRVWRELRFRRNLQKAADKKKVIEEINSGTSRLGLYYGNLNPSEPQYNSDFIGLAKYPRHDKEIYHDACERLPFKDGVVLKIQSQDVFEHIEFERVTAILDDIYRVLAPGGVFRLSVPDYRCSMQTMRCVFDDKGRIIADTMMGGSVVFNEAAGTAEAKFTDQGDAHLWFPTIEIIRTLIEGSDISRCSKVQFHHYFAEDGRQVVNSYPDLDMPVWRAPPIFMWGDGEPISIIIDFEK